MSLKTTIRQKRHAHLLKYALRGDERSFQSLYRELYVDVINYVSRKVRNKQDAEDLVSTVFHRFLVNLESYDSHRGSVLAWITTIARNIVTDHLWARRDAIALGEDSTADVDPRGDVLSRLIEAEQLDHIIAELTSFPEEINELFSLRVGMGMSWREISQLTGWSESAARMRFSRTIKELRNRLREGPAPGKEEADYV